MTPSQTDSDPAAPGAATRTRHTHARLSLTLLLLMLATQLLAACGGALPQGAAGGLDLRSPSVETLPADAPAAPAPSSEAAAATRTDDAYWRSDGVQIAPLPALLPAQAFAPQQASAAMDAMRAALSAPNAAAPDAAAPALAPDTQTAAAQAAGEAAQAENAGPAVSLEETINVLVLGSDRRVGTPNWRTDVMMIVALDATNGRAGVISIPRDIFIDNIPGHNPNKINVVDYLGERDDPNGGGPALLSTIIAEKLNVRIDHWVRFDFTGFVELVNALGGVEVEIDCPYYDYFQIENVILNVKPGMERLSGEEALVYVRSRKIGGDLDRARRQQRFVWAVRNQVLNENILPRLPALYNAVSDTVQTDLGIVGTLRLARIALGLDREDITGFVIGYPLVREGYAGNMWVFRANWDAIQSEVQNVFARAPFLDTNTLAECP